jgi:hypothetical protein
MYKLFLSIFLIVSFSLFALESNEIKEVIPIHNENIATEEETLVEEVENPKNNYNSEELKASNVISTNKDLKENKKEEYASDYKSEEISDKTSRVTALGSAMGAVDLGKIEERKFRIGAGVGSSNNTQAVAVGVGYAPTDRFRVNTKFSTSSTSKRASAISIGASVDLDW